MKIFTCTSNQATPRLHISQVTQNMQWSDSARGTAVVLHVIANICQNESIVGITGDLTVHKDGLRLPNHHNFGLASSFACQNCCLLAELSLALAALKLAENSPISHLLLIGSCHVSICLRCASWQQRCLSAAELCERSAEEGTNDVQLHG